MSDGRYDANDCFDSRFVLIALIHLYFPDCPDWFRFPRFFLLFSSLVALIGLDYPDFIRLPGLP